MHTEHIDNQIEAYIDDYLSAGERQQIESHLANCPPCAQKVADARYLHQQLAVVFQEALGQPALSPDMRRQLMDRIADQQTRRFFPLRWHMPVKIVNAVGTVSVVALLAFGAYTVIQGQNPDISPTSATQPQQTLSLGTGGSEPPFAAPTATLVAQINETSSVTTTRSGVSVGDLVSVPKPVLPVVRDPLPPTPVPKVQPPEKTGPAPVSKTNGLPERELPGGTIAYPLFNGEMYQVYLIQPDGTGQKQLPLAGVSEPALHPTENDYAISVRSWNDPDGPRNLVTSGLEAAQFESVTNFWEDAQPDWSPVENRIIFASQRESDRKWRLYTAWGDGSLEINLRREGKAPTFAPDGYRFAFESCHQTGKLCGLWQADLDNSEFGAEPFLDNPLAKSPDWSPVSEDIVYMANTHGNWDVYAVNSSGDNIRRLTDDPAADGLPVWSPDGKWIAFVSDRGGQWGLWLLHINSGDLKLVTTLETGGLNAPERLPYTQHGERQWWEEQISWGR